MIPPISEQQVVKAIMHRPGEPSGSKNLIPKIIIQTNEHAEIPQKMFDATNTLLRDNPDYTYLYFTDDIAAQYLEKHYDRRVLAAYHKIIPGAYKADVFRYCVLYKMGGVYIDMGMVSLSPLDKIIKDTDTFISPEDCGREGIYNAVIACAPQHPIIKRAIELVVGNIEREDYTYNPLGITGPILFGRAFRDVVGEDVHHGRDYGEGIRIIEFSKYNVCESGKIHDGDQDVLATRYPSYRTDQLWYNTKPHYSEMWEKRTVFA